MDHYTSPDFSSLALITIDTQRDTLDGQPLDVPGTSAILPTMRHLLLAFRESGGPIIHMVRLYKEDGSNAEPCRRSTIENGTTMLAPGSLGSQLAQVLLPAPDLRLDADLLFAGGIQQLGPKEVAIYKPRWGAFYETPLEMHLRELGVTSLAFSGCNFPNCPRTSIYEASERDFRVVLVEDAVSGLYGRGKAELRGIGVSLMSAQALEQAIAQAAAMTN